MAASAWTPVDETASAWKPVAESASAQDEGSFSDILGRAYDRFKKAVNGDVPLTDYDAATLSGVASIARGTGHAVEGIGAMLKPPSWDELQQAMQDNPQNPGAAILARRAGKGIAQTAKAATQVPAAVHDINASPDPLGTYAKAAQETAGEGAGQAITALATEGAVRGAPKVVEAAKKVPAAIDSIRQAAPAAVQRVSTAVRAVDPDLVGIASPRAAHALKVAQRAAKVASKYATRAAESTTAAEPAASGAEEFEGVTSPQTEAAGEALEHQPAESAAPQTTTPAAAPEAPPKAPVSNAALKRQVSSAVDEALGNKPLKPGVPLKDQIKIAVQAQAPLPEGFTPVDSTALKGYKYSPEANELESVTTNGQHYVHGDVSPEQFEKFEAAESKGKAWNDLRKSSPLVAKVVNGQRVAAMPPVGMRSIVIDPETGQPEFSDVVAAKQKGEVPPAAAAAPKASAPTPKPAAPAAAVTAPEADLTSLIQQSLDQVKAKPGGVFTSAEPKALLDRWGVDPESFTEGRSQTRGLSPQETEAQIKKLTAAYKKGQPVEPVLETRDADNNIIDVDGRGRALAAHRAGVDRIPVIVRRVGTVAQTQ